MVSIMRSTATKLPLQGALPVNLFFASLCFTLPLSSLAHCCRSQIQCYSMISLLYLTITHVQTGTDLYSHQIYKSQPESTHTHHPLLSQDTMITISALQTKTNIAPALIDAMTAIVFLSIIDGAFSRRSRRGLS
jgi:hypothetical protein